MTNDQGKTQAPGTAHIPDHAKRWEVLQTVGGSDPDFVLRQPREGGFWQRVAQGFRSAR
jgi:hypothetical protein